MEAARAMVAARAMEAARATEAARAMEAARAIVVAVAAAGEMQNLAAAVWLAATMAVTMAVVMAAGAMAAAVATTTARAARDVVTMELMVMLVLAKVETVMKMAVASRIAAVAMEVRSSCVL